MARTTKQLSGGGKDKFLRAVVGRAAADDRAAADRIGLALCGAISDVRVRRELWEELSRQANSAGGSTNTTAPAPVAAPAAVAPSTEPAEFDPFAFSAMAVLARKGRPGLAIELARIDRPEHLRRLAEAQHLSLADGPDDIQSLRDAVIAATEQRIAERRAAAS